MCINLADRHTACGDDRAASRAEVQKRSSSVREASGAARHRPRLLQDEEWEKVKAARNLALARERARQRREHATAVKQAAKDGLPAPAGPDAEVPF